MNGGSLYQHSKPTNQSHDIETTGGMFHNVAAGHHQIMRPSGNYEILGWNPEPTLVWINDELAVMVSNTAEVVWWPDTKCLAIQPHPEWEDTTTPFNHWINNVMKRLEIDYEF